MKQFLVGFCILLLTSATAFAGNKQGQQQGQGQAQGQIGINKQGQAQGQIGINKQGQAQGQIGINKQSQGAYGSGYSKAKGNETEVNIDQGDTEVLAPTWASTPSTQGKEEVSAYSLWGGLNKNELGFDVKIKLYLELLSKAKESNQIDQAEYDEEVSNVLKWTKAYIKPDKVLGIISFGCGNALVNLILCW